MNDLNGAKMPLTEWDITIGRHLHYIVAGADVCRRHVGHMMARPTFQTLAEDEMLLLESALDKALTIVREARAAYGSKPHVD
jgi:hypothetical protein